MNRKTRNTLQFIGLLLTGIVLIGLSVYKLNLDELLHTLQLGNYWMLLPVYCVSISGYYFRILRWRLLYSSMEEQPRRSMLFVSLCVGYLVNFAVPRLGEISRCAMIKKSDHVPFNKSLISIVIERSVDILVLFLLLFWITVFNTSEITSFLQDNIVTPIQQKMDLKMYLILAVMASALLFAGYWFIRYKLKNRKVYRFYTEFTHSIKDVLMMKQRTAFILFTIAIWFCYFLMTYLWLFTFPESASLGMLEAFIVMVIGSVGRSVPIQGGGMGAYHFLVSNAFALFGVSLLTGNALAIVIHGAQMGFTVITGLICFVWFLVQVERQK